MLPNMHRALRHFLFFRQHAFMLAMATLAMLWEAAITWMLLHEKIAPLSALLCHGLLIALMGVWLWRSAQKERKLKYPMLLTIMTAALGVIGACMMLFILVSHIVFTVQAHSFSEWFTTLFPKDESRTSHALYERIVYGLDETTIQQLEPYTNILHHGTYKQKQLVIAKITKYFHPRFAPLLLQAVGDGNNAVRVQAATALAKLEHHFMEQYMDLQKTVRQSDVNRDALITFGQFCEEYLHSGILDQERMQQVGTSAIDAFEQCHAAFPEDTYTHLALARLYHSMGDIRQSNQWYARAHKAGQLSPRDMADYMDVLYRLGQFDQLRQLAHVFEPPQEELNIHDAGYMERIIAWKDGVSRHYLKMGAQAA